MVCLYERTCFSFSQADLIDWFNSCSILDTPRVTPSVFKSRLQESQQQPRPACGVGCLLACGGYEVQCVEVTCLRRRFRSLSSDVSRFRNVQLCLFCSLYFSPIVCLSRALHPTSAFTYSIFSSCPPVVPGHLSLSSDPPPFFKNHLCNADHLTCAHRASTHFPLGSVLCFFEGCTPCRTACAYLCSHSF